MVDFWHKYITPNAVSYRKKRIYFSVSVRCILYSDVDFSTSDYGRSAQNVSNSIGYVI